MAKFEYERGMATDARRAVHADLMLKAGKTSEEAWEIVDNMTDGRLRYEYGRIRSRQARKAREQVLRDLGMVKVRGAMGGTYWE